MIKVVRCLEPADLAPVRIAQLASIRALGRPPLSADIDGYSVVAEALWKSQFHKCCYCEARIQKGYNDVEHYRPKTEADRRPGSGHSHGYWWLAFTWENLLFACPNCNRSNKKARFPLDWGSHSLFAEEAPPGNERPLLLDPGSAHNPVEHIEFVYRAIDAASAVRSWWARPRNGSVLGNSTIDVCGLNRIELRELREDHYKTIVLPHFRAIDEAIGAGDVPRLRREFDRALALLHPSNVYVGLTYDALRHLVPDSDLRAMLGVGWPPPSLIE